MIKVVEVISDTNIGGAGVLLANRLEHSPKDRFETVVLLPKGSKLTARLHALGIKTKEINSSPDRSLGFRSLFVMYREIRRQAPDIVNTHASADARIAAFFAGVPVRICTRHCYFEPSKLYNWLPVRRLVGTISCALTHHFIAVADAAAKNLMQMGIPNERISVIINGARPLRKIPSEERSRLKKSLGIDDMHKVVCICARLEGYKGHDCFIGAAEQLLLKSDDYRFIIIGTGSLEKSLRAKVRSLGLDGKIIFTGFVDDVAPLMNICDVNVNCSSGTETSCLALSEGMSLGVVSVASDYGGNPYMVRDGENGYLYPTGNSSALAECIKKACSETRGKHLSVGARRRFKNELNAQRMARDTYMLYEDLYTKKRL